jgi:hypothetical protein
VSGNTQSWNQDAPGGIAESEQAVRDGLAQAYAAIAATQVEAARFFTAAGRDVVAGHPDVGKAGRQGDPDVGPPDASDY